MISNVFICDPCSLKLVESVSFKEKCTQVYSHSIKNIKIESSITEHCQTLNQDNMVFEEEEHLDEELLEEYGKSRLEDPLSSNDEDIDLAKQPRLRFRYSLKEKLNAIKVAEAFGNRKAEKLLSIGESCIRKWRSQKTEIQSQEDYEKCRITKVKTPSKNYKINELPETTEIATVHTIVEIEANDPCKEVPKEVKSRKSYFSSQKLEAIAFAEVTSNRKAAKVYKIDESCIRKWRLQKDMLENINRERGTRRKPNLRFPELEQRLKEFVIQKMDQEGILMRPQEIKAHSIKIAHELNITNFKGTSSYIFKFMERYQIPSRRNKMKIEDISE